MRFYLFAVLSLVAVAAHGQAIFKCKQPDGSTAFQDHPCPGATNARPDVTIKPGDTMSPKQAQAQRERSEALDRLSQSLDRLKGTLQEIEAKRAQRAAAQQQGATQPQP